MKFITLENLNTFWEGIKKKIPTKVSELTNDAGYLTNVVNITGNAATATKLQTARTINGVAFDGTSNITITDSTKVSPTGTIVANRVPIFNDTTGKVIKDSGFTINSSVPANAKFTDTVYTHPTNHPASIITQDTNNRFVTDAEKNAWNLATTKISNLENEVSGAKSFLQDSIIDLINKL